MEFENLQAIWDTQNDTPVFTIRDPRLVVALYQQREQSRRRIFREQFAPMYLVAPIVLGFLTFLFIAFIAKSLYIQKLGRDFPMTTWDYVAFVVGMSCMSAAVASIYRERERHERTQNVFAPTLREELGRGIAQLDFELSLQDTRRVMRILVPVFVGSLVTCWEAGRLNGDATPWNLVLSTVVFFQVSTWAGFAAKKKMVERVTPRRRALESMRAALDEAAE